MYRQRQDETDSKPLAPVVKTPHILAMDPRDTKLQNFLDSVADYISVPDRLRQAGNPGIEAFVTALDKRGEARPLSKQTDVPVLRHLPVALQNGLSGPQDAATLVSAFAGIAPQLQWFKRPEAKTTAFTNGHANAHILGPTGIEYRTDILLGVTLMEPDLTYPTHRHPPEEVYIVLSHGEWQQSGGSWTAPKIGGLVYNPSNVTHAMRSGPEPLLALWCLWTET